MGLARAWSALCEVGLMWCHASDMDTASERAAFHAERADDRAALLEAAVPRMAAPALGMDRPEIGIQRCEEVRAWLPDDRFIDALADTEQAGCAALLGQFDQGRRKLQRGEEILLDLGQKLWLGAIATNAAPIESWRATSRRQNAPCATGWRSSSRSGSSDSDPRRP